jgi:CRISPR-associated protein Cas2
MYLIAYDITDPPRLNRVARFLKKHAFRVQYSVFAAELSQKQLRRVLAGLEAIIDPRSDDVRAYPVPHECEVTLIGPQMFPEDILLVRDGRNLLRLSGSSVAADDDRTDEKKSEFD